MGYIVRYYLSAILLIPVLPILYFQGRRVRKVVPKLPEAEHPTGVVSGSGNPLQLLVIGESTMAGVGVSHHEDGFAGALAHSLGQATGQTIHWQVIARSGFTVRKVRTRLLPQTSGAKPDLIIMGVGGNDAFQLTNPIAWRSEIRRLIDSLLQRFPGCPVFFTAVPPIREFPAFPPLMQKVLGGLVEMLGSVLQRESGRFDGVYCPQAHVDVGDWLKSSEGKLTVDDFFSDGVHPASIAYSLWGKVTAGEVLSLHLVESTNDSHSVQE